MHIVIFSLREYQSSLRYYERYLARVDLGLFAYISNVHTSGSGDKVRRIVYTI